MHFVQGYVFAIITLSNNIGVDPKVVCHFSGKPSTTRLNVAKYLYSVCS